MTSRARSSSGVVCVFVLLYKWNGTERIVQHRDIYGDDGSVSRKRSNIYLDEREGSNEDDADFGKGESKDTNIDWGWMIAIRGTLSILIRLWYLCIVLVVFILESLSPIFAQQVDDILLSLL